MLDTELEETELIENNDHLPLVSVIMPVRNEEAHIDISLGSVIGQDYPLDCLEVIIVDGMSTDHTRQLVWEQVAEVPELSIQILDNPDQIVPSAMNIGIQASRGEIIARVDGHCKIPRDYLSSCVAELMVADVQAVGGMQYPVGDDYISDAVALAISSPYFIGNSYFRYAQEKRLVDTVFLGVYPRDIFDKIGLFDEELVRHQDYDLNLRLRNQGGKILYLPNLKVEYRPRDTIASFFKQYFQYGLWKVRVMQKSRHAFRLRHFAPTGLVLAVVLGALLSLISPPISGLYLGSLVLYLLGSLAASLLVSLQARTLKYLPILPIIFMCIHFGWGTGFWWGAVKWNILSAGNKHSRISRS